MFVFKHQGDSIILTVLLINMGIQFSKYQVDIFSSKNAESCPRENLSLGLAIPYKSDQNQPAQVQRLARILKFCLKHV